MIIYQDIGESHGVFQYSYMKKIFPAPNTHVHIRMNTHMPSQAFPYFSLIDLNTPVIEFLRYDSQGPCFHPRVVLVGTRLLLPTLSWLLSLSHRLRQSSS